jgi:hypothetical protein
MNPSIYVYASDPNLDFQVEITPEPDEDGEYFVRASDIGGSELRFWTDAPEADKQIWAALRDDESPCDSLEAFWEAVTAACWDQATKIWPPDWPARYH